MPPCASPVRKNEIGVLQLLIDPLVPRADSSERHGFGKPHAGTMRGNTPQVATKSVLFDFPTAIV